MYKDKIYLVYLHSIGFTHNQLNNIFKIKNNYREIYEEKNFSKYSIYGLNIKQINILKKNKNKINKDLINKKLINNNIQIITKNDNIFPKELNNIFNSPYFIYLKWKIPDWRKIWVIWSREITKYWIQTIENIVPELSKHFTIISWGAIWCDTYAHRYSKSNNTIVIIWTWIDLNYPKENKKLFENISNNWWWIISIFPISEEANRYNFPIRNELIAWLSEWIVVIEAKEKSWSLITVKIWLDLWKDIFAIPWSIYNLGSNWTNKLIQKSEAKLIQNTQDILEEYDLSKNIVKESKNHLNISKENSEQQKIYLIIKNESININEISIKSSINILKISVILSELEIKWYITKNINWKYTIK